MLSKFQIYLNKSLQDFDWETFPWNWQRWIHMLNWPCLIVVRKRSLLFITHRVGLPKHFLFYDFFSNNVQFRQIHRSHMLTEKLLVKWGQKAGNIFSITGKLLAIFYRIVQSGPDSRVLLLLSLLSFAIDLKVLFIPSVIRFYYNYFQKGNLKVFK